MLFISLLLRQGLNWNHCQYYLMNDVLRFTALRLWFYVHLPGYNLYWLGWDIFVNMCRIRLHKTFRPKRKVWVQIATANNSRITGNTLNDWNLSGNIPSHLLCQLTLQSSLWFSRYHTIWIKNLSLLQSVLTSTYFQMLSKISAGGIKSTPNSVCLHAVCIHMLCSIS